MFSRVRAVLISVNVYVLPRAVRGARHCTHMSLPHCLFFLQKRQQQATGEESCAELNECLMSTFPFSRADCKCARCVCTNTPGGYK